jgi:hypothetical protein
LPGITHHPRLTSSFTRGGERFQTAVDIRSHDELGELAALNQMSAG